MACAPSEDSDQPGHPPSLIRVFALRMKKAWVLNYPLSAQWRLWSDWADAQASAQSDQSSLSTWRQLGSLTTHWAHSEDSDQTGQMTRLIWVFAGRTVILLVLSWGGSFCVQLATWERSIANKYGDGKLMLVCFYSSKIFEPRREKTFLRCLRPGLTQTGLRSHRS